jgi:hypothetical protein
MSARVFVSGELFRPRQSNVLAYWAHLYVTKKTKYSNEIQDHFPRSLQHFKIQINAAIQMMIADDLARDSPD